MLWCQNGVLNLKYDVGWLCGFEITERHVHCLFDSELNKHLTEGRCLSIISCRTVDMPAKCLARLGRMRARLVLNYGQWLGEGCLVIEVPLSRKHIQARLKLLGRSWFP